MPAKRDLEPPNVGLPSSERGARPALLGALFLTAVVAVLPGEFGSAFGGPPLSEAARWWLTAVVWLSVFVALVPPVRRVPLLAFLALAVLMAVKLWLASGSTVLGWQGTYEMLDEPRKQATFAWRFGRHPYRIDRRLVFDGQDFGLHFLNDNTRYGHKIASQTRDVLLPLRMSWRGFVLLQAPTPVTVSASARGSVRVLLNGAPLVIDGGPAVERAVTTPGPAAAGWLGVHVVYEKPPDVSPAITVRLSSPMTGDLDVRPFPTDGPPPRVTRVLPDASMAVAMLAIGFLGGLFLWAYRPLAMWRPSLRRLGTPIAVATLLGVFGALLFAGARDAIPYLHQTFHLWSGDDPLVNVSNARSVLLEGWLMPNGFPVGKGEPFYHYPFFAYVVGPLQAVIGEDYSAVRLVNAWFVAFLVPLTWWLGWRERPWWVAAAGITALGWLVWRHMLPYALIGYTDSVFIGLVFVALVACRRALAGPWWWAPLAGLACAVSAATRPSFLTFTPLYLVAVLFLWRGAARRARVLVAAGILAGFVAGLAPFTVRNYVMAGRAVVLVSSWIQLPYFLIPPEVTPNPVLAMFSRTPTLGESLGAVAQIVARDPVGVLGLELRKLAFTFGVTHWGMPGGSQLHPEFLVLSVLFAAVLILRRLPADLLMVVGVFAFSHVMAMVMAAPWTYGYKTILPLHAVFLFSAAYLLPYRPPVPQSVETEGPRLNP